MRLRLGPCGLVVASPIFAPVGTSAAVSLARRSRRSSAHDRGSLGVEAPRGIRPRTFGPQVASRRVRRGPRVLRRAICRRPPRRDGAGRPSAAPVVAQYPSRRVRRQELPRFPAPGEGAHGPGVRGGGAGALPGRAPGEVRWPRRPRRAKLREPRASRTDAGVHALDATAHVDIARERRRTSEPTSEPPPPHLARSVKSALNHFLKRQGCEDVRVEACVRVCPRTFHARSAPPPEPTGTASRARRGPAAGARDRTRVAPRHRTRRRRRPSPKRKGPREAPNRRAREAPNRTNRTN